MSSLFMLEGNICDDNSDLAGLFDYIYALKQHWTAAI